MYNINNSKDLSDRMNGINRWIFENLSNIGNANMYEIASCMIARNNLRVVEGRNPALDEKVNKMVALRGESIVEFITDVPECIKVFKRLKNGMVVESQEEKELVCKSLSVPFFINNTHKRGFDGDIKMSEEVQESMALKNFEHDNTDEIMNMVNSYNTASDEVKNACFESVNWVLKNSISSIKDNVSIENLENGYDYAK